MCVCALLLDTFANLLHRLTKHAVAIGIIILMMSLWELSLPLFVLHLKWLFYRLKVEVLVCCRLFQACFYVNTKSLLICILQLRIIIYFLTKKIFARVFLVCLQLGRNVANANNGTQSLLIDFFRWFSLWTMCWWWWFFFFFFLHLLSLLIILFHRVIRLMERLIWREKMKPVTKKHFFDKYQPKRKKYGYEIIKMLLYLV